MGGFVGGFVVRTWGIDGKNFMGPVSLKHTNTRPKK